MKRNVFSLIISVFMVSSCTSQTSNIKEVASLEANIDALVKQYEALDIFSGIILVSEKGEELYHKAFGLANREKQIKNTVNTKFDIGSMNKSFTKAVILQLIEENKLKATDNLGMYLNGFPQVASDKITIKDLLEHSSGYSSYWGNDFEDLPIEQKRLPALVERIKKLPLHFEPGTDRTYSNSGYVLLGAIIERITNKSYHQNVVDRIITPLGLTETYVIDKDKVPNRAIGYYKNMKGELFDNMGILEVPNPDGGFQSTPRDVMKFYNAYFYGNKLLSEATKMNDDYFGFVNENRTTGAAIPMAGGFEGANTAYFEILRDEICIIVFANMDEPVAEQLGSGILNIVRGKTPKKPSLPAIQNVYKAYKAYGFNYVRDNFYSLIDNFHAEDPKGLILNHIGYELLEEGKLDEALGFFKLNVELFPEDANLWDSLGEVYYHKKDKTNALKYYKKALSLDPNMDSAKAMIAKIEKL